MVELKTNVLYYGDNLEILRKHIPDESIDLIYLDPPFSSQADYNVLFREPTGELSEAQIKAFSDTWHWDLTAERTYGEIVAEGPPHVAAMVGAMREFVRANDLMAYLVMMTARLTELHRVLKATGSIYLHCDPKASHYLKIVMDTIFGKRNLVNEIVWKRSDAHSDVGQGARHLGRLHDVILFYSKSDARTFNAVFRPLPESTVESWYRHVEPETGRRYNKADLSGPRGAAKGNPYYEWNGHLRYWRVSRERMQELHDAGRLAYSKSGIAYLKRYLDESKGVTLQDWWDDVPMVRGIRKGERLGYQTQKPLALLERIIEVSSNEGGVVLDPFCGCGTALVAAHKLKRAWIGIDITHLAITVMKNRLHDSFPGVQFEVVGEPADVAGAGALAEQDRYQFEWWALSLVNAKPVGDDRKKGRNGGIDGIINFVESGGRAKRAVVQVKSGHVNPGQIRDLKGTMQREKAEIGLFLTLEPPTQGMISEAASAGFYHSELWDEDYPRIQICTIEELLEGKQPKLPRWAAGGFPKAQKIVRKEGEQAEML